MAERPIFFEVTSVLAIRADLKTQTRRAFRVPEDCEGRPAGIAGNKENGMIGFVAKERVDGKLVLPEAVQVLKMKA